MYKKYFCTFADSRMKKSLDRIKRQSHELEFFDTIVINNENDLDSDFQEYFKDKLIKGSRGYGYWVWKPQIILQALREMKDGDILLYADAGCHLNKNGIERLKDYFEQAAQSPSGIFSFQEGKKPNDENLEFTDTHLEKYFTKADLFYFFKTENNQAVYNTGQIAATAIIIKKCEQSQKIIESWLSVFKTHFNLANDTPSINKNFDGFIGHRHDQSIFSILGKINNIKTLSAYEIWQNDWGKLKKYPILAKRDKDLSFYWRGHQKFLGLLKKIMVLLN